MYIDCVDELRKCKVTPKFQNTFVYTSQEGAIKQFFKNVIYVIHVLLVLYI